MTSKEIFSVIERHFHDHRYPLQNVYLFDWESDMLSVAKSGLIYEFEVKTSRSDFRADFKKTEKHKILASYATNKLSTHKGSMMAEYHGPDDHAVEIEQYGRMEKMWYPHTTIHIKQLDGPLVAPNYFFYVCPVGVIPIDEVPKYAGLIMIGENFTICRPAPRLHKVKHNFQGAFLDKYFWKYRNLAVQYDVSRRLVDGLQKEDARVREFLQARNLLQEFEREGLSYS